MHVERLERLVQGIHDLARSDLASDSLAPIDGFSSIVVRMYTSSEREEDRARARSFECVGAFLIKAEVAPEALEKILTAVPDGGDSDSN